MKYKFSHLFYMCVFFTMMIIPTNVFGQRGHMKEGFGPSEDAMEMVNTLKIWKITETLEVDEELADKLFPKIRRMEENRRKMESEREVMLNTLKQIVETENPSESNIQKQLKTYLDLMESHHEQNVNQMKDILKLLTPEQQAKYLILEDEFPRRLRDFMRAHRHQQGNMRNQQRGKRNPN